MEKEKDNVITDAIQNIRSKCPQSVAYKIIEALEPFLEPCRIRLIGEYFSVVAEIEKDKKRLSKTKRQDYLKRLLTPLVNLNRLHPSGENPYLKHDGTYPFIEEKIWLDKEINIESLHYDKQRYSIDFEYSKPLSYFDPDARNIIIWDEYREYIKKKKKKDAEAKARGIKFRPITPINAGKTSLRELYKKWLPVLTEDKIKSKDLLDQILVCFTIKRALNGENGDEKAINKLYSIYEKGAIGTAVNMAKKCKLNKDDIDEIKQEAKILLRFLISGFRPEDIINSLLDGKLKMPLQVEKFYLWYYSDHVPKELDKIMKRQPNWLDEVEFDYLLNPISIIDAYTFWQGTPKRVMKFNSYSFRPNKEIGISAWLFGKKALPKKGKDYGYMMGKLPQLLKELLKKYTKNIKGTENYHYLDGESGSEDENTQALKIRKQVGKATIRKWKEQGEIIDDEKIEKAINILCNKGISKRDAEIFIKNRVQRFSQTAIAQEYDLSRKTIYRIIKKISSKYPIT